MLAWLLFGLAGAIATAVSAVAWRGTRRARDLERRLTQARSELDRRLSELFSLQELSYVLSNAIDLAVIADQAVRFLARFIELDGVVLATRDEGTDALTVVAGGGVLGDLATHRFPAVEAGLLGRAIHHNRIELAAGGDGPAPVLIGGRRVARAAVAPLHAHGATIGAVAISRDTDRAFAQEDLRLLSSVATHATIALTNARFVGLIRAARDQWEATFDALDDGVAVLDDSGRIHRANAALSRLIGRPLPDVIGLPIADALAGSSPDVAAFLDHARTGGDPGPITVREPTRQRMLQVSAFPMPHQPSDGWLVVVVGDITHRKAMETQLIRAERMAAVGQLVSGVAHELNNPLTSITGLAEFLVQQPDAPARAGEHLRVIHEQAERAARIVRNLLTFARKGPADVGPVDLNEMAQRVVALMSYEVRLRKVDLEVEAAAALPLIDGDRYQLQQVMLNLLTNAVQAVRDNPPERRRVRLRTRAEDRSVLLSVEDNGPGIPDETVSQIFDPFFTTKQSGEGTGLGLSITYGIVEGHGGHIVVRRAAGGGAIFEVSLPATGAPASGPAPSPPDAEPAPSPARDAGALRILLVDDDPAVRQAITALFSRSGAAVVAAPNAPQGVQLLRREPFDLILGDPRAAVSSTETLADVLTTGFPELKSRTVFLTADVRPETDAWLTGLGWRYFRKPFNVRELQAAAREMLGAEGR